MFTKKLKVILAGGGRLAGLLVEIFSKQVEFAGYIDDVFSEAYVEKNYGLKKLGKSTDLAALKDSYNHAVVAITDVAARKKYGDLLKNNGFELVTLVSSTAIVANNAKLGAGCIVRHSAVIGPNVIIGDNTVISDQAYIGHDSRIGQNVYIAPKVSINGSATIRDDTFLGTGSVILPEIEIGAKGTVGAQACVTRKLEENARVIGIPAVEVSRQGPPVSIVMAAYNHENYVGESIRSALDQTFRKFEFIIIDDGSADGTADEIRKFSDSRIKTFFLKENQGIVPTKSLGYRMAKGKYIAILNSDDAYLPEKLERQTAFLDTHPDTGVVFTHVSVIDEQGNPFANEEHFYYKVFDQPNRDRHAWLRHLFFNGNCLCAPSAIFRREIFEKVGWPDPRLHQLSDLDWWIRICMQYELHILQEPLTRFRVRNGDLNASGTRPEVEIRDLFELPKVLRHYLAITDETTLLQVFPEAEKFTSPLFALDRDLIHFVIARMAMERQNYQWRIFGAETMFGLLADSCRARKIHDAFGYAYKDFIKTTGTLDYRTG